VTRTQQCQLRLNDDSDVAAARRRARELALGSGLPTLAVEELVTAVSEIAHNVVVHAARGELLLAIAGGEERPAVVVIASDDGPGIANIEDAMRDGYSTGRGLGLGLPSARRLVDEFEIRSSPQAGTVVTLRKWLPSAPASGSPGAPRKEPDAQ